MSDFIRNSDPDQDAERTKGLIDPAKLGDWMDDFIAGRRHLSVAWGEKGAVVHESNLDEDSTD